ncbi:MAG TPA: serine hydrolase domain-containing protein, partial [Oleiagrimonas sp.]|nr:serine hydrolase domain-containing protein [Oleiagrimonas sp.]
KGKLDLDRDINAYLDFTIPKRYGEPITLRDLMTHTPGFEDTARGLMPTDPDAVDLGKYLKTHIPARIFPPGEVVAYSNYGCGLAGYIVQRVSGMPFEDYIREHIFEPLGMDHSTFEQPLPANLAPLMAKGYKSRSDGKPQPFELVNPAPAGAMSTTALDMARFMIAQLHKGRYRDTRILDQATAELMHSPQHTEVPGMNGFDLGFYQENRNGQRIIGHAGDTNWFHSDLHLLLDADVGMFVSFNSAGNRGGAHVIRRAIFRAFMDRYYPYHPASPPTVDDAAADAGRVVGWYQSSRRNESALSMLNLFAQMAVVALPDGTLVIPALTNAAKKPLHWRQTGPLRYQEVHGRSHVVFVANKDGSIRYWATDDLPPVMVFQRVSAWYSQGLVKPLVSLVTLLCLITLLTWFCGWWVRKHYGRRLDLAGSQRTLRLLSRLGALALVVLVVGWLVFLIYMTSHIMVLLSGAAVPWMYVLYVLGVLALLGALAMIANAVRAWLAPRRGWWVLAGETLLALAAVYAIWFIFAFDLVSFNVQY